MNRMLLSLKNPADHRKTKLKVPAFLLFQGRLTDEVLSLFDTRSTRLERVTIKNAAHVSTQGLRVLRPHNIHELEAVGLVRVSCRWKLFKLVS